MPSPHTLVLPRFHDDNRVEHTIQLPVDSHSSSSSDKITTADDGGRYIRLGDIEGGLNSAADPSATMSFWFPERRRSSRRHRRTASTVPVIDSDAASDVNIIELKQAGLLANYLLLGCLDGALPVLTEALYVSSSVSFIRIANSRKTAALLRVFFAVLSDTLFESTEFRRRAMMMAGWVVVLTLSCVLTGLAWPSATALPSASAYAVLLMLLPIGQVIIGAGADGLMLEYSHREEHLDRGCVQMLLLATRVVGELIGRNAVSSGKELHTDECVGAIDCVLSPAILFAIIALISVLGLVTAIFITKVPTRPATSLTMNGASLRQKASAVYKFHARKAYVAFLVFGFVQAASFAWAFPTAKDFATEWLTLSQTTRWISDSFTRASQMAAALLVLFAWRNASWRVVIFVTVTIASLGADVPSSLLILLKASTTAPLFLAAHHLSQLCKSIASMVRLLVAAELAMPYMEATSFAFSLTVMDLGTISSSLVVTKLEPLRKSANLADTAESQWIAIMSVSLGVLQLVANVASLHLVPTQKGDVVRSLQRSYRKKKWVYGLLLGVFATMAIAAVGWCVVALVLGTKEVPWGSPLLH